MKIACSNERIICRTDAASGMKGKLEEIGLKEDGVGR